MRQCSPDIWVVWAHARSAARLDESLQKLADDVENPDRTNPSTNVFQLVRYWLLNTSSSWVLVLDNADDPSFLFACPDMPDQDCIYRPCTSRRRMHSLPTCTHGSIIITIRNRAVAYTLVEECDASPVLPMYGEHAVSFLEKKSGQKVVKNDMESLAAALDSMPLAIGFCPDHS